MHNANNSTMVMGIYVSGRNVIHGHANTLQKFINIHEYQDMHAY